MRISSCTLLQNALRGIRKNLDRLDRAQNLAVTGRRIERVSDSPTEAVAAMRVTNCLADITRYQQNARAASIRLTTEDVVLESLNKLLLRASDVAVDAGQSESDTAAREAAVRELGILSEQILSLGNTKLGGEYLFGGAATETPPMGPDGTYLGNPAARKIEVGSGVFVETNHTGDEVFAPAFEAMQNLTEALDTGDPEAISVSMSALQSAIDGSVRLRGEVGVRLQYLDTIQSQQMQESVSLEDRRDAILNADPAEAAVGAVVSQSALETAYAAISRVLSASILRYLQ